MIPTKGAHRGLDRKTQHIVEVVLDIIRWNVDNRARTTKTRTAGPEQDGGHQGRQ